MYKSIPFKFDLQAWADALNNLLPENDLQAWADVLGVHTSTLRNWRNGAYLKEPNFPHPSMGNFLYVCNELDLDPRTFFSLQDE